MNREEHTDKNASGAFWGGSGGEMSKLMHDVCLRTIKLLNIIWMAVPFAITWYVWYARKTASPFYKKGDWAVIGLFIILYFIFGRIYDAFLVSLNRLSEMVYSQCLSVLLTDFVMYVVVFLLMKHLPALIPISLCFAAQFAIALIWSYAAHTCYFYFFKASRTAIIYDARRGMENLVEEYKMDMKFDISSVIDVKRCLNDLSVLDEMDTIFLSGIHSHSRNTILKYCIEKKITVYVIPRIGDVIMSGAKPVHLFHLPILRVGRYAPSPEYLFFKRMFDLIFSLAAIVVFSPLMAITAAAIKREDGGPVFYKQLRLTKDGESFYIWKFRSMKTDAEQDGIARLSAGEHDRRITSVGKWIRKLRIDEMPQLFQIMTGKMSIVGPRPERPEIAACYEKEMPEFRLRLQAKAGLTGYAQVYGKYNTTPYDKLMMDLMYIAKPSLLEDLRIMLATIKILFLPESTEGIAEGAVTAAEGERILALAEKKADAHSEDAGDIGLISVIMAAYNAEKTIAQAIGSVLSQTYTNLELLVIDDGSADNTVSIVESFQDSRIHLIRNPVNSGVSKARHRGAEEAKGEWIAILDSDDAWKADKLKKQAELQVRKNAELLFTGSAFMNADGRLMDWVLHAPEEIGYRKLLKQNLVSNSSVLVRKELYITHYAAGDAMHEDFSTWLGVLKTGRKAYGLDEPLLIYRLSKHSKSGSKLKAARMNWNTYRAAGLGIIESMYYMCWYIIRGFMKYRNLKG